MRFKNVLKATFPFIIAIAAGCSSYQPISVEQLNGSTEVAEGETATIQWNFKNAEYVRVEGIDRDFKSQDTLTLRPDISKNFKIIGYRNGDSAVRFWNVRVYSVEPPVSIQTGPITIPVQTSNETSEYFGGNVLTSRGNPISPHNVKILSAAHDNGSVILKTLPLDRNGNFLDGLDDAARFQWMVQYRCEGDSSGFKNVSVTPFLKTDAPVSIAVCLDRSASAAFSAESYMAVRDFSAELTHNDEFGFIYFNQDIGKIPLQNPAEAQQVLKSFTLPAAHGLSAVYKAAFAGIDMLDDSRTALKALVVITGSADNASIIYTADDIALEAKKLNIPVYTVRVGDATESYPLKYISSFTGGKYYYLPNDRVGEIGEILKEITAAQKIHYKVTAPDAAFKNCTDVQAQLVVKTSEGDVSGATTLALEEQNLFPQYQALAVFAKRDTVVSADYREVLKEFADVLKDNPTKIIELTGNSSTDGDDDYNMMIALKRAQTVRRALVDLGAKPSQIRVRAEGNRRPVYYFQNAAWQEDYNRRVEVRWLDPALLPYEITAGIVATEDEALLKTDVWEKRGAKAYYETIYYQKQPAFRVKLWGYPTYGDAAAAARELGRKFGEKLTVE
jgi:outer membrane protein OmpA-like peptidoglycan-associated protein